MSSRTWWIAGALVLGAIALVVLVRPAPPTDSPAASPPPPEAAAVPDEPRRGVDVGEEIAAPEPPAQAAAPSEVVEQNREAARSIPAPPDWAANFAAESVDAEWAPRAETEIVSRFSEQPGLQLITLQVECRTTMCQVLLTQPSPAPRDPPMDLLKASGMQPLSMNTLRSPPGMQSSVSLLARPGREPFPLRQQAADPAQQRP